MLMGLQIMLIHSMHPSLKASIILNVKVVPIASKTVKSDKERDIENVIEQTEIVQGCIYFLNNIV